MLKVKRSDVILIERNSSYTMLHGKTVPHRYCFFARAHTVTRDGRVEKFYKLGEEGLPYTFDKGDRVMTITDLDKQILARNFVASLKDNNFDSLEQARDALLGFQEALA